jgi:hypothetical protein
MMGSAIFSQSVLLGFIVDLNLDAKEAEGFPHLQIGEWRARTGECRRWFGLRSWMSCLVQ